MKRTIEEIRSKYPAHGSLVSPESDWLRLPNTSTIEAMGGFGFDRLPYDGPIPQGCGRVVTAIVDKHSGIFTLLWESGMETGSVRIDFQFSR